MEVRWTAPAAAALAQLQDYISQESPASADRVTRRILDAADGLADNPLKGRLGRVSGTRELVVPCTSQIVAYTVRGNVVEVLELIHAARQWPERFE